MNKIDLTDERYLVIEDPQKNSDKLYNEMMEHFPYIISTIKSLPKEKFIKFVAEVVLNLEPDTLKWMDFQFTHINEKVVWDTETGEMFTIE